MKVLFAYRYLTLGGVETVLRGRILGLQAHGIEAHAIFLQDLGGRDVFAECAERIRLGTVEEVTSLARDFDLLVSIDTPEIAPLNEGPGRPWLLESHSSLPPFIDYLRRLGSPLPRALVVPSRFQATICLRRLEQPLHILVVPNSVGDAFLAPIGPVSARPPRPVVAMVGRTDEIKNWRGGLDAAEVIARSGLDFELWFIGRGGARGNEIFSEVRDRGLLRHFRWLPGVPAPRMPGLLDAVRESGGALLTTSRRESLGMAVLEAMARACPVVGPAEPPFTEYLRDDVNALLAPPGCSREAAAPLLRLLRDGALRARLGNEARRTVEGSFSSTSVLARLAGIYRAVVDIELAPLAWDELLRDDTIATRTVPTVVNAASGAPGPVDIEELAKRDRREADLHALCGRLRRDLSTAEARTAALESAREQEISRLRLEQTQASSAAATRLAEAQSEAAQRLGDAQAEARIARSMAERHRLELLRFQSSRLWKLGSLYWALRRALGLISSKGEPVQAEPSQAMTRLSVPTFAPAPPGVVRPPIPGGQPPLHDVVCLPIIDWEFRFQRPQQLMARYAAAGHRVFYVSQHFRSEGPPFELREVRELVFEVSLRAPTLNVYRDDPGPALESLLAGLDCLRREVALGATAMVVQLPFWWPLAERARALFAWPVTYDCLDLHSGFSTNESPMLALESALLSGADLVLASAAALENEARRHNANVLRLPNACDFEHFAGVAMRRPGDRPVVGYYGAISDWFDSHLVAELAARNPEWHFLLIGSTFGAELGPLRDQANVELVGEVPYPELPTWLARFDVCLIPFRRTPLTEATDPVKVYEMLAAGKPVVSVPLPEVVALGPLVRTAEGVTGVEQAIAAELGEPDREARKRGRAFAAEQTWQHRFERMAPAVAAAFPKLSVVIVTHNNADLTSQCLESIEQVNEWPNRETLVVDNASSDDTPELLARWASGRKDGSAQLNSENRGFAAANNQALARARGEFLVLLNNDTVVTRGALATLTRHLHAHPGVGLLGPCTNAISNAAQVAVGYRQLSELPAWVADWTWRNDGRVERIDMAAMFCLAMRRETYELLGPLDERFAVGMFEDDDYSVRARRAGLEVCCAYDAFVHHWQRSAFRLLGEEAYLRVFEENRRRFADKWGATALAERTTAARQLSPPPGEVRSRATTAPGTVVFLPSVGWGIHLLQRPHHLARALARRGYLVVFDCSNAHDAIEGFAELEPNLFLFRGDPETLHTLPAPLLWSFPYNFHLCAHYPEGAVPLYDWIDDLAVFPYEPAMLERNHRQALANAPIVASVAQRLHREAAAERADALYLPNAVDLAHFAAPPPPPDDPAFTAMLASGRHIAGYYGALADWFDYELVAAVAAQRPDWGFVLIGPDYEGALARNRATLRAENILCLGPRDYVQLPAYLARFDVATIPFRINDITLATSPLKLYEYFAGGKPVVTSPMPECRAFSEVLIAEGPDAFSRALDEALARAGDPAFRARLRELARVNDWSARIDAVLPLWEARRHIPRQRSPWVTRAGRDAPPAGTLPLAGSSETRRDDSDPVPATSALAPEANPAPAAETLATRFAHLRPEGDRRYFDALLDHLSGIADHPFLPVYVEYAATAVQRGRLAVATLRTHLQLAGARVLDIGCAYGGFLVALAEAGAVPLGIDVNDRLLALSRHLAADHEVPIESILHDASVARPEFESAFDLIVANDVIEHVAALDPLIANVSRWLAPRGTAYLEIPNGRFPGFVRKDGHHGAFAVSLLEFSTAAELLRTTGLASKYDTFNYLTLAEYRSRFAEHGLQVELLPGSVDGFSREAVVGEVEALRSEWPARVEAEVPPAFRDGVSRALRAYLEELDGSGVCAPGRDQDLYERYGASFWRVLCRHG